MWFYSVCAQVTRPLLESFVARPEGGSGVLAVLAVAARNKTVKRRLAQYPLAVELLASLIWKTAGVEPRTLQENGAVIARSLAAARILSLLSDDEKCLQLLHERTLPKYLSVLLCSLLRRSLAARHAAAQAERTSFLHRPVLPRDSEASAAAAAAADNRPLTAPAAPLDSENGTPRDVGLGDVEGLLSLGTSLDDDDEEEFDVGDETGANGEGGVGEDGPAGGQTPLAEETSAPDAMTRRKATRVLRRQVRQLSVSHEEDEAVPAAATAVASGSQIADDDSMDAAAAVDYNLESDDVDPAWLAADSLNSTAHQFLSAQGTPEQQTTDNSHVELSEDAGHNDSEVFASANTSLTGLLDISGVAHLPDESFMETLDRTDEADHQPPSGDVVVSDGTTPNETLEPAGGSTSSAAATATPPSAGRRTSHRSVRSSTPKRDGRGESRDTAVEAEDRTSPTSAALPAARRSTAPDISPPRVVPASYGRRSMQASAGRFLSREHAISNDDILALRSRSPGAMTGRRASSFNAGVVRARGLDQLDRFSLQSREWKRLKDRGVGL